MLSITSDRSLDIHWNIGQSSECVSSKNHSINHRVRAFITKCSGSAKLRSTVSLVYAEQSRKYSNEQWLEHFFILKQFGSSAKQTPWYNFLRLAVESALARNRRRDVVALCMRRKCF